MCYILRLSPKNMSCIYESKTRSGRDLLPNLVIEQNMTCIYKSKTRSGHVLHLRIVSEKQILYLQIENQDWCHLTSSHLHLTCPEH